MQLLQIMQGSNIIESTCDLESEITDICYDSRRCTPGCVFVAIRGFEQDGNSFIPAALEKGAAAIVTDVRPEGEIPFLLVDHARGALADMSANFFNHPEQDLQLVGVTGTNGKTTVASLVQSVIRTTGARCGLIGTNGHMVGDRWVSSERTTPESYEIYRLLDQMRSEGCQYAVMEVSSHSLVLERVRGLTFAAGIFTNLSQDHLDFHKDMETYLEAKARLFDQCRTAVLNYDDKAGRKLIEQKKCAQLTYSAQDNAADLVAKNIQLKADRVEFEAVTVGYIDRISMGIPGMFSVYNALAAIGGCMALGLDYAAIANGLACVAGVKGRAEVVPVPAEYTVILDYAHSPDSMQNILKTARPLAKGRVIGLFGCGGNRDKTKRPVMGRVGAAHSDVVIITSDNPRNEDPEAIIQDILPGTEGEKAQVHVVTDRVEAIGLALTIAQPGDVVVLMGKGHETYQEVGGKKIHLDEREIIRDFFA